MSESASIPGPDPRPQPVQGVSKSDVSRESGATRKTGETFRALLESLERRAGELEARSREELDSAELAGAVDAARESMHDALALQEDLLEAWRQSRHQADSSEPESGTP